MDFIKLMNSTEYDFLRTNPRLGKRVILQGLGGSYAYGTNYGNSDIDFRGITLNLPSDLLGLDEDQYLIKTALGQELLEHKHLFLTKRAAKSFGGYASAQLRRLQNAIARDSMPQQEREQHIYIDESDNPELQTEIFIDAQYEHLPLRDYENMLGAMNNVVRDYDKIGKRNRKKDDNHLNKHAMHLIRLFMMAIDILEKGEIRTHRTDDLELLRSIRRGGSRRRIKRLQRNSMTYYLIMRID